MMSPGCRKKFFQCTVVGRDFVVVERNLPHPPFSFRAQEATIGPRSGEFPDPLGHHQGIQDRSARPLA